MDLKLPTKKFSIRYITKMSSTDLSGVTKWLVEQERKYPDAHKKIHKHCCKQCPTNNIRITGEKDMEVELYRKAPKEILIKEIIFTCAWRPSKLCKGICDEYGITQDDIDNAYVRE